MLGCNGYVKVGDEQVDATEYYKQFVRDTTIDDRRIYAIGKLCLMRIVAITRNDAKAVMRYTNAIGKLIYLLGKSGRVMNLSAVFAADGDMG